MQISVSYRVWHIVRLFGLVFIQALLFGGTLYIINWLALEPVIPILLGTFMVLMTITVMIIGFPDKDVVVWYEEQLQSSSRYYSTLYEDSPIPYITLDKNGCVSSLNQTAVLFFGGGVHTVIGNRLVDRFSLEDETHLSIVQQKISRGIAFKDEELMISTNDDVIRWVSVSSFVNETYDQRLVSLIDITQHKIVDKAKSEFIALATHQLRTPVAAIRWNVELLEMNLAQTVTSRQQNYLLKISRNVTRMLALINDFLSVSKLETGTFTTDPVPIELSTYLPTIVEEYEGVIKEKGIQITTSYQPAPCTLTVDSRLLHIIVSNLLSNATKYSEPNGFITLSYIATDTLITLAVADSGIGIPKDQMSRLFTKFFRADNALHFKAEGTGLGLYIVRESVAKLGGSILVESVENKGTTFTVSLPLSN